MTSGDSCRTAASRRISVRARKVALLMSSAMAATLIANRGLGATGTWTGGGSNGSWSNGSNWSGLTNPQTFPGTNSGPPYNSTDIALFNSTTTNNTVENDPNINIGEIYFDTSSAGQYNIGENSSGDNPLIMSDGGLIEIDSTVTSATDVIYSPLVIQGANLTLENNSTNAATGLQVSTGGISGGVAETATLTLSGNNNSGTNQSNSSILGPISNGTATTLNLVVDDSSATGVWELNPSTTNTYTGSTTIEGGILRLRNANSLPTTTNVLVEDGGTLRNAVSGSGPTANSLTINADSNGTVTASSSSDVLNLDASTGAGLTITADAAPTENKYEVSFDLTGTGAAGTDGVNLVNSLTDSAEQEIGSSSCTLSLGSVSRTFDVPQSGIGATLNSTDLQVSSIVTGSGGIIKTGTGTLKLDYTAGTNSFTGQIEIQQGSFKLAGSSLANSLVGTNPLLVDGGTLNINGANATFGAATFTAGSTTFSTSDTTAAIIAPSYTFTVGSGNTFQMQNVMADYTPEAGGSTVPAAVVSNGTGTVEISNAVPTYTGGTTISSGTYNINVAGNGLSTGSVVNNGTLGITATTGAVTIPGNVTGTGSTNVASTSTLSATGSFSQSGGLINNGTTTISAGGAVGGVTGTGTLNVGGGTLQLSTNSGASAQSSLTIAAGADLDVTNNSLTINYGSGADPKTTILGYLSNGAAGGSWNGPSGIVSSTAASHPHYGVGYADGADHVDSSLTSGQLEIAYVQYGDITLAGLVNAQDFSILSNNFGHIVTGGWEDGDFLYQGTVNAQDFSLLASNFGQTETGEDIATPGEWAAIDAFAAANGLSVSSVPEPATLGIVALTGIGLLQRRRKRRE